MILKRIKNPLNSVDLKFESEDEYTFEGYASVFDGDDSVGDTIKKGAFNSVVETFKSTGKMPIGFYNHEHFGIPVVKWLDVAEDSIGLKVKGRLTRGIQKAEELRLAMLDGNVDGISIGIKLAKGDYETKSAGRGRVIHNVTQMPEISVVTFPADGAARIDLDTVKSAIDEIETLSEFEQFLREVVGCSKSAATAVTSTALKLSRREAEESDTAIIKTLSNFKL